MKLSIPLRTYNRLNGSVGHWAKWAKHAKTARRLTFYSLKEKIGPDTGCAMYLGDGATITLRRIGPTNGLDSDNLPGSVKAIRDGIADWMGIDDRDPRVTWRYEQRRERTWAVEIEIERPT